MYTTKQTNITAILHFLKFLDNTWSVYVLSFSEIQLLSKINDILQQRQDVVQQHNVLLQNSNDLQNQVQQTKERVR